MKKIGEIITISKVWDKCRQWTTNRVFDHQNPNHSMENLNYAYAMTDDIRTQFFNDYFERVVRELETDDLLIALRKYNRISFGGENLALYFDADKATFFFVVGDYFPCESFNNLLHSYCQWKVLYYWYWEKDLKEQYERILVFLEGVKSKIQTIANGDYQSTDGETMRGRIPYNDGFIINPPRKKIEDDIPTKNDETEYIGENTPEPEPETKTATWFIAKDLDAEQDAFVGDTINFAIAINKEGEETRNIKEIKFEFYTVIDYNISTDISIISGDEILLPLEKDFTLKTTEEMVGVAVYVGCTINITFDSQPKQVTLQSRNCIINVKKQSNGIYSEEYNDTYA